MTQYQNSKHLQDSVCLQYNRWVKVRWRETDGVLGDQSSLAKHERDGNLISPRCHDISASTTPGAPWSFASHGSADLHSNLVSPRASHVFVAADSPRGAVCGELGSHCDNYATKIAFPLEFCCNPSADHDLEGIYRATSPESNVSVQLQNIQFNFLPLLPSKDHYFSLSTC